MPPHPALFDSDVAEHFRSRYSSTLVGTLGMHIVDYTEDSLSARVEIGQACLNSRGFLHGGMTLYLTETLSSFASLYLLRSDPSKTAAAISVNGQHYRIGKHNDTLTLCTKALSRTSRLHCWITDVHDSQGQQLHRSEVVVAIFDAAQLEQSAVRVR